MLGFGSERVHAVRPNFSHSVVTKPQDQPWRQDPPIQRGAPNTSGIAGAVPLAALTHRTTELEAELQEAKMRALERGATAAAAMSHAAQLGMLLASKEKVLQWASDEREKAAHLERLLRANNEVLRTNLKLLRNTTAALGQTSNCHAFTPPPTMMMMAADGVGPQSVALNPLDQAFGRKSELGFSGEAVVPPPALLTRAAASAIVPAATPLKVLGMPGDAAAAAPLKRPKWSTRSTSTRMHIDHIKSERTSFEAWRQKVPLVPEEPPASSAAHHVAAAAPPRRAQHAALRRPHYLHVESLLVGLLAPPPSLPQLPPPPALSKEVVLHTLLDYFVLPPLASAAAYKDAPPKDTVAPKKNTTVPLLPAPALSKEVALGYFSRYFSEHLMLPRLASVPAHMRNRTPPKTDAEAGIDNIDYVDDNIDDDDDDDDEAMLEERAERYADLVGKLLLPALIKASHLEVRLAQAAAQQSLALAPMPVLRGRALLSGAPRGRAEAAVSSKKPPEPLAPKMKTMKKEREKEKEKAPVGYVSCALCPDKTFWGFAHPGEVTRRGKLNPAECAAASEAADEEAWLIEPNTAICHTYRNIRGPCTSSCQPTMGRAIYGGLTAIASARLDTRTAGRCSLPPSSSSAAASSSPPPPPPPPLPPPPPPPLPSPVYAAVTAATGVATAAVPKNMTLEEVALAWLAAALHGGRATTTTTPTTRRGARATSTSRALAVRRTINNTTVTNINALMLRQSSFPPAVIGHGVVPAPASTALSRKVRLLALPDNATSGVAHLALPPPPRRPKCHGARRRSASCVKTTAGPLTVRAAAGPVALTSRALVRRGGGVPARINVRATNSSTYSNNLKRCRLLPRAPPALPAPNARPLLPPPPKAPPSAPPPLPALLMAPPPARLLLSHAAPPVMPPLSPLSKHPDFMPYNWRNATANPDYCHLWGIADQYLALCLWHACANPARSAWCAAGRVRACRNECNTPCGAPRAWA